MKTCILLLTSVLFVYGSVVEEDIDEEELKEFLKIIEETDKKLTENDEKENDLDEKDNKDKGFVNDPFFISSLKCRIKCGAYRVCVKVAKRIKNKFLRNLALKACSRVKGGCSC